jgi:hypothetical protein
VTVKTDGWLGWFGYESEADWEKEFRDLEEIDRQKNQDYRLWDCVKSGVLEDIESLEKENAQLRTDIQSLKDELKMLTKSTPVSTNLYLVRKFY